MDRATAEAFAQRWVAAWNDHDVEAVLGHFAEDVVISSPHAVQMVPGSAGVVHGKDELRAYWREGLRLIGDLHFELVDVYVGVETVVIHYRNQRGGLVAEVFTFEGPLIAVGHGTYLDAAPYHPPAG